MFNGSVVALHIVLAHHSDDRPDPFGLEEADLVGTVDVANVEAAYILTVGLDNEIGFLFLGRLF